MVESKLRMIAGNSPDLFDGVRVEIEGGPHVLGGGFDFSEHEAVERDPQKGRDFSRTIIQALSGIFFMLDARGYFVHWNQRFEELLGLDEKALAQTKAPSLFLESEQALIRKRIKAAFQDGKTVMEAHLIDANGTPHAHHLAGHRLRLAGEFYLLGVAEGITDRKEAEDQVDATIEDALDQEAANEGVGAMGFNDRQWERHISAVTEFLIQRDEVAHSEAGLKDRKDAIATLGKQQLWQDRANRHLQYLARLADAAPDPIWAMQKVEELRRWSGIPRTKLPPSWSREIPMLLSNRPADRL